MLVVVFFSFPQRKVMIANANLFFLDGSEDAKASMPLGILHLPRTKTASQEI